MAIPVYPEGLPLPLRDGYSFDPTNLIARTEMVTGRARQRLEYRNAPTIASLSWMLTQSQAQLFQAWVDQVVGAGWCMLPLLSPLGFDELEVRFTETPGGPELYGKFLWRFTAKCEIRWKPLLPPGWAEVLPEYILHADIFDVAMNQKMPLNKFYTFRQALDEAINQEWPTP